MIDKKLLLHDLKSDLHSKEKLIARYEDAEISGPLKDELIKPMAAQVAYIKFYISLIEQGCYDYMELLK